MDKAIDYFDKAPWCSCFCFIWIVYSIPTLFFALFYWIGELIHANNEYKDHCIIESKFNRKDKIEINCTRDELSGNHTSCLVATDRSTIANSYIHDDQVGKITWYSFRRSIQFSFENQCSLNYGKQVNDDCGWIAIVIWVQTIFCTMVLAPILAGLVIRKLMRSVDKRETQVNLKKVSSIASQLKDLRRLINAVNHNVNRSSFVNDDGRHRLYEITHERHERRGMMHHQCSKENSDMARSQSLEEFSMRGTAHKPKRSKPGISNCKSMCSMHAMDVERAYERDRSQDYSDSLASTNGTIGSPMMASLSCKPRSIELLNSFHRRSKNRENSDPWTRDSLTSRMK